MEAFVEPSKEESSVSIAYPPSRPGLVVMEQEFTSGKLDFDMVTDATNRFGKWTGRSGSAGIGIGYRVNILSHRFPVVRENMPQLEPYPTWAGTSERVLAERLVKPWQTMDPPHCFRAIAAAAVDRWQPLLSREDISAWRKMVDSRGKEQAMILLLRAAGLPVLKVEGLKLYETVSTSLLSCLEVWTGKIWECLDPMTGFTAKEGRSFLPLVIGETPAVEVEEGDLSDVRWILSRSVVSQWQSQFERIRLSDNPLNKWSLFHLPAEFQDTFRILMLVPLGALLISILRNVVGLPTFGIFMPVLMALAFRNTGLAYGLGLFTGIIMVGFLIRLGINWLRLLLVPRLSLILTMVIMCIVVVALIGNKYEVREMMAVGLLPFVILTMTIERFFVIIEEAGIREGFWTAFGSAAVACITYLILNHEPLQLVFFMYPEMLLVVAGVQILLGRYTGYRLMEFYRFRKLRPSDGK